MARLLASYLLAVTVAAILLIAFGGHFAGLGLMLLWPLLLPLPLFATGRTRLAWLLTGAVILELAAAQLAWHTVSELDAGLMHLALWLNALVVVAALLDARRIAGALTLALFALLVPPQIVLGIEWTAIHIDAERMLQSAKAHQARTGETPESLPQFEASFGWIERHLHYRRIDGEPVVSYWIGTPSTSHWSTPEGWAYYPD